MLAAILRGKVSRSLDGAEDLLTSSVFGVLQHLPLELGLLPVLRLAVRHLPSAEGGDHFAVPAFKRIDVSFWPSWSMDDTPSRKEPDVAVTLVLEDDTHVLLAIECKRGSGKSGTGDRDQLAMQGLYGLDAARRSNARFAGVLYVTPHLAIPGQELYESRIELNKRGLEHVALWWLSWRDVCPVLEHAATHAPSPLNALAMDAAQCLKKWNLERYYGVSSVRSVPAFKFQRKFSFLSPCLVPGWQFGGSGS